jgi:hypothetical protein
MLLIADVLMHMCNGVAKGYYFVLLICNGVAWCCCLSMQRCCKAVHIDGNGVARSQQVRCNGVAQDKGLLCMQRCCTKQWSALYCIPLSYYCYSACSWQEPTDLEGEDCHDICVVFTLIKVTV